MAALMTSTTDPLRVAIVGTGNIGTDLLLKVIDSPALRCEMFTGRRAGSPGIALADSHGVPTSVEGIDAIVDIADRIDIVFDATSARDAARHWSIIEPLGPSFIDLTPANLGKFCVPALNLDECLNERYLGMVTCGGQAAVPMAVCVAEATDGLGYVEIVSASSSASVGPASRANLDEYVVTTQKATHQFCDVDRTKTVLIINPAEPGIVMRNSITALASERVDMDALRAAVELMEKQIQTYVPGYRVVVPPVRDSNRIMITVEVEGRGDWLPRAAGNLDIITCAAVAAAEARSGRSV
ncbi:acetaldehyde dehydrogenase [Micromonospora parathelypteridis]|uniref:Acetaldehyde dehydrogenase n=2 Tax=Micromonospora parathelypteridis TaxID=1839617 RepID=A0A840VXQ8_9ACTN|nr:acetaldehyde dehydrogenase [Micromonospora parathelypteridis]GGO21636.1 acetaldehyde dehydrogenase [Micromonospora parathelypteridis]